MKKIYINIVFSLLLISLCSASVKKKVGVAPFTHEGASKQIANTVSEVFQNELVNLKSYDVLDRNNMAKTLKEMEFQQTGLTDPSQAVKMGKMLNVEYMIYGTVSKLNRKYIISVNMVNIQTSKIEKSANHDFFNPDDADRAAKTIVNILITGKKYNAEKQIHSMTNLKEIKAALIKKYCTSSSKYTKYEILGDLYAYDDAYADSTP